MNVDRKAVGLIIPIFLLIIAFILYLTVDTFQTNPGTFPNILTFLDASFGLRVLVFVPITIFHFSIVNTLGFIIICLALVILIIKLLTNGKFFERKIEVLVLSLLIIISGFIIMFTKFFSVVPSHVDLNDFNETPMLFLVAGLVLLSGLSLVINEFTDK